MTRPTVVSIIHARGGSKRIPLKNLCLLGGKPLLAYPIELCRACDWIDRVIVSTDHDDIMREAREYGAEVPFRRPADISEDVPSEFVTLHALQFLAQEGTLPEYVITLTPATPFTRRQQLEEAFALFIRNPQWDCITTVRKGKEFPEWIMRRDAATGDTRTVLGNLLDGDYNVSQKLPPCYFPSGMFWINKVSRFLERPSLYGERWGSIITDPKDSVDIDWPEDLEQAEALLHCR
jgi:CMP-N-acetylneuraminic acid synthetase